MFRRRKRKTPRPSKQPLSGNYNRSLIAYALESDRFRKEVEKSKREFWGARFPSADPRQSLDPSMIFWADWFVYCTAARSRVA